MNKRIGRQKGGKTGKKGRRVSWNEFRKEGDRTSKGVMKQSSKDLLWGGGAPIEMPQTREEWYQFTLDHFPIPIPGHRLCKDHDVPLDFFIQYVTGTLKYYINLIFASRESFKTYVLAMGMVTKCMFYPDCEIMHLGGIKQQAEKAYKYASVFWGQFIHARKFLNPDADILTGGTSLYNKSISFLI